LFLYRKLGVAAALLAAAATASAATIQVVDGEFRVSGWERKSNPTADLSAVFRVYAADGDVPPMIGSYSFENGTLIFRPRFPLAAGVRYRAVFQPPSGTPVEELFDGPKTESRPLTYVTHVYPSTEVLPSNELKLYLCFSAPMSRGEAWKHIHLLDEAGKPVPMPFVEIDQELWDPTYERLTVLFDPGRIKRGLVPRQEMGTPIVEGRRYTLVIDRDWRDAGGITLAREYRKAFQGGPEDRTPPDPNAWSVTAPKAGTSDDLVLHFPDPMDFALLQRMIEVSNASGQVAGKTTVSNNETEWRFRPTEAWKAGSYSIVVDTRLEDLAGNHLGRAFDVDTYEPASELGKKKTVTLTFDAE
jgi:hypothetical protein